MADYLPRRDAELLAWSANWSDLINDSPETFGLSIEQASDYRDLHDAFAAAYAVTQGPERGPVATQTKNTAREALIREPGGIRQLVRIVQTYPGTTDAMRVQLNITVPQSEPTPVPPPDHAPEIDLHPPVMRRVPIVLHNEEVIGRRGRPDGVRGALVFSYIGPTPPSPQETDQWTFEKNTTRTSLEIEFPPTVANGATVWITARWYNPTGESGPASAARYAILPGSLSEAA